MHIIRLAYRNLYRHPQRTLITLIAVAFVTIIMLCLNAFMKGMVSHNMRLFTQSWSGSIQISHPQFQEERSIYQSIDIPTDFALRVRALDFHYSERAYGAGLIAAGKESLVVQVIGVDPYQIVKRFNLPDQLRSGSFLSSAGSLNIVIGSALADRLKVGPGDQISLLVTAVDGSLSAELFTVAGVLSPMGEPFDLSSVMISLQSFQDLFAFQGVHEIAIQLPKHFPEDIAIQSLKELFPTHTSIKSWTELIPFWAELEQSIDSFMLIFYSFFAVAGAMGLFNTMLMSADERIREFAVIRAIGASRFLVFLLSLSEGFLIALFGYIAGALLSFPLITRMVNQGVDLSSFFSESLVVSGLRLSPIYFGQWDPMSFVKVAVFILLLALIATLYPAWAASRVVIVKALHYEN